MPVIQISGASSVSPEGLVYVASVHDDYEDFLPSATVYNVFEDEWKLLPEMNQERDECYGAFIHNKFFVINGYSPESGNLFDWSAEIYDPEKGAWSMPWNMWTVGKGRGPQSCMVASSQCLLSFHKHQGVMEYDFDKNVWRAVGSLPNTLARISCCIACNDNIFVFGFAENDGQIGYAENDGQICYKFEPRL